MTAPADRNVLLVHVRRRVEAAVLAPLRLDPADSTALDRYSQVLDRMRRHFLALGIQIGSLTAKDGAITVDVEPL
jgi:hypothetical protein